jgi:hypothetical protein
MATFQIFVALYVVAPAGCFAAFVGLLPITAQKNEDINPDSFAVTFLYPLYGDIGLPPYIQLKKFRTQITS